MKPGIRYIVTHASAHGEFQPGDRVWMEPDGSIMCQEAEGWMPAEDVPAATLGWEIKVDPEWADRQRQAAYKMLEDLDNA